jgi:hypothetical protein
MSGRLSGSRFLGFASGLAALLFVGACADDPAWQPARGPVPEGCGGCSLDRGDPRFEGLPIYTLQVGAAIAIEAGTKTGYVLTADRPGSYKFRWTGDALVAGRRSRRFNGAIWTSGHFTSLVPGCGDGSCALEKMGDYVSAIRRLPGGGERIDWVTTASEGWDGFSFTADSEPVFFDVNVEGEPRSDLFAFPAAGVGPSTPASNPFGIASRPPRES